MRPLAPQLSIAVDPATNRVVGSSYDANGNATIVSIVGGWQDLYYDAENRLVSGQAHNAASPAPNYAYDARNERIWSWTGTKDTCGNATGYQVYMYTPGGQKLATYQIYVSSTVITPGFPTLSLGNTLTTSDMYFGARRLSAMDRLSSVGKYYPYGEDKGTGNPTNDNWKFGTYWRDAATTLDYAMNRYYSNNLGRFMTPDPYRASASGSNNPPDTGSWNRYAYVGNDPVNFNDPHGLYPCQVGVGENQETVDCEDQVIVYPGQPDETPKGERRRQRRRQSIFKELQKARDLAFKALRSNADCYALFAGGTSLAGCGKTEFNPQPYS